MPSSRQPLPEFNTFDEVLDRLGDIPPSRIRVNPAPGTATEQDVIQAESRYNCLCELVDRTLVEKPVGYYELRLACTLIGSLEAFLLEHDLGIVLGEAGMVRVAPKQVRLPDVCFLSWEHFSNRVLPRGAVLNIVPDLAVEILSPTNTKKEMQRKRKEYFFGGCKLVWEVEPEKHQVRVYTAPDELKVVREKGTLDGGEVLPGFKLSVALWFSRTGRREKQNGAAKE